MASILIVDEAPTVRSVLRAMLTHLDYEAIEEATSGQEALQRAQEARWALIIIDMTLLAEEGEATVGAFQRLSAEVPLLAMAGLAHWRNVELLTLAHQAGARCLLNKPFSLHELQEAVGGLLSPGGDAAPAP